MAHARSATRRSIHSATAVFFCLALAGCGTLANGKGWGQDATLTPGWNRVGQAALNAVKAPETWVPAAAAVAFRIDGDSDRKAAEWAMKNTPVFGSVEKAGKRSDDLLNVATAVWAATALAAPGGNKPRDWTINKAKLFGVQAGAGILVRGTVGYLKESIDRTAPNRHDGDGFPSGHVTSSAYFATLAARNIETLDWPRSGVLAADIGLGTLSAAEAWARVEAFQHYPSDALGSLALGHFLGAFVTDAFLGSDNPRNTALLFEFRKDRKTALLRLNF